MDALRALKNCDVYGKRLEQVEKEEVELKCCRGQIINILSQLVSHKVKYIRLEMLARGLYSILMHT